MVFLWSYVWSNTSIFNILARMFRWKHCKVMCPLIGLFQAVEFLSCIFVHLVLTVWILHNELLQLAMSILKHNCETFKIPSLYCHQVTCTIRKIILFLSLKFTGITFSNYNRWHEWRHICGQTRHLLVF